MQYHCRKIKHTVTTHLHAFLGVEFCGNSEYLGRYQIEKISVATKHLANTGLEQSLVFLVINLTRARRKNSFKHLYEALLLIKSQIHVNLTTQTALQPAENMLQVLKGLCRSPGRIAALLERNYNKIY